MRKIFTGWLSVILVAALTACVATSPAHIDDGRIHVTILHFNDIYEITPVSGGKEGGIARVATLHKQLLARNPNTITTLGGDLFSPSAIGTAQYQGEQLAGRQMVDVLNHFALDYATFGNHEFDLKEQQFFQRLQEAQFTWVSSNVFAADGQPYAGVKQHLVIPVVDKKSGKTFRIGMFGLTLPANQPGYVRYSDSLTAANEQIVQLSGQADFIIALTHQAIADDIELLEKFPQIGLLLGGHEHVNYQNWRGNFTPLLKGDANVRSVYVVDLHFDPQTGKTEVKPTFVPINDSLAEDVAVKTVVDKWMAIAFDAFRQQGFEPEAVITNTSEALDGLESNVRTRKTNLTELIAKSLLRPYPEADLSLYNSGSIRIDDVLPPGQITVYDIIRVLPFGGKVQLAEIKGELLLKVLNQGIANTGSGGFLQSVNTRRVDGVWKINDTVLDPKKTYRLAINDFLASGRERGLDYLKPGTPDFVIVNVGNNTDIRQLVIEQLKSH
ncbi:MAG: bifunctional metallophosphatase/5'-nucleotidase [Nitrosomonas sp.]|jgi:5'-nucleotidase/UDP-sugar diphosphatase|uniref:bifunctional metallophosphatase/5'-nucleotidase n=1 Tax=Nitrosomonas sp. TaxID=42353 RepID=UPI001E00DDDE|nr:bifunctional metallophosphatase/5'-nucleotidase [Nitrosomonas sp.]MBX9896175.1 bifunctional metallophosphatase/5'-nucleotidase [Nitrosomonas sp.]